MKKASLETVRDGRQKSRKCTVLRELAAKKKRPAVVEFTAGRVKLGGGAEEIRTLDPHVANVVL